MKAIKLLLVILASLIVVACGGGGDNPPPATTLSGTAAVGAPIVGAAVNVTCAAGTALSNIPVTSNTGAWSVTLSGQTLPCAVQVSGGKIRGAANTITYQSIANAYGIVNVTPLTDLLVANLAGSAAAAFTPAQLAAITPANVATALTKLRSALALSALNTIDPITTAFTPTGGVPMDDILSALQTAMTNSGTSYASLLASATSATFTTPTNFKTALTTAYSSMGSGTAAQYFSKKAAGNTWTWAGSNSSEVMTITASTGGVATFIDTYTSGGTTYPTDTGTLQLNAAGAWTATIGTYTVTLLPATFVVGTTWISKPGNTTGDSPTTSTIAAFNVTRTVPAGTFTDCLQINETSSSTNAGVTTVSNSTSYYSPTAGIWIETLHVGGGTEQLQTYGTVQVNGTAAQYFSKKAVGNTWTWFDTSSNSTSSSARAFTVTASSGGVATISTTKTTNGVTSPPVTATLKLDTTGAWVFSSGTYSTVILPATFSVGTTWVAEPADSAAGTSAVTDTVKAFNVTRTVPAGTFTDCLQVDSTFTHTQQQGGLITTYNSTRFYSPKAGLYVDGFSSDSNGSTGTEQLQAGYVANP